MATLRRAAGLLLALAVAQACSPQPSSNPNPVSSPGPPRVREEVVARHARQFNEDDPDRRAGSQGEQIAAAYLVAHLQTAGYGTFLDPVPVSNLVRSTNVVATPPSGRRPLVAVTVPYDTPPVEAGPTRGGAEALGLFLELARALSIARPQHRISFVALGAERAEVSGGRLGSRRLVIYLRERSLSPLMVVLEDIDVGETSVQATGDKAEEVVGGTAPGRAEGPVAEVLEAAGLDVLTVSGGARETGDALLGYLGARAR
ncbi:MAG: hypothetical protein ACR2I4_09760 [Actinomycetota bacterium]|nr:hypothetical protein [Actinomycetota bacterium]